MRYVLHFFVSTFSSLAYRLHPSQVPPVCGDLRYPSQHLPHATLLLPHWRDQEIWGRQRHPDASDDHLPLAAMPVSLLSCVEHRRHHEWRLSQVVWCVLSDTHLWYRRETPTAKVVQTGQGHCEDRSQSFFVITFVPRTSLLQAQLFPERATIFDFFFQKVGSTWNTWEDLIDKTATIPANAKVCND